SPVLGRNQEQYRCEWSTTALPDSKCVRDSIYVVEPRRDECDLQNPPVVEPHFAEPCAVVGGHLVGCIIEFRRVVEHRRVGMGQHCQPVVQPKLGGEFLTRSVL